MHTKTKEYALSIKNNLSKPAQTVVSLIAKNGKVSTDELSKVGYDHPPRAIRDVREAGIPIETKMVTDKDGRRYAEYTFGEHQKINRNKIKGRITFPKSFKEQLLAKQKNKCNICNETFEEKLLQIDHRIPYEFAGNSQNLDIDDYMLLCPSCNKKKDRATETGCSKTCFKTNDLGVIKSCFWATPENYTHICMNEIRMTEISWHGDDDLKIYEYLERFSQDNNQTIQDSIKKLIQKYL